jgi:hypothetical protein
MAAYRSFLRNTRKLNLQLILNKNSPRAHRGLKFDMLGVAKKLVKYGVHFFKRIFFPKYFSLYKVPRQQRTNFWSQQILGIKHNWKNPFPNNQNIKT